MSIFTPSSGDLSVHIFNHVFGVGWQDLFTSHGLSGSAGVLATMFHTFNIIVLSGVTLFFMYVMTTGVIGSAYEGNVGGKRLHNFWVPVRGVVSVSMLSPLPWLKGYCLIQALILMFIGYGIGAADTLWGNVVTYLDQHPGEIAVQANRNVWPLAEGLLETEVLYYYLQTQEQLKPTANPVHWVKVNRSLQKIYNKDVRRKNPKYPNAHKSTHAYTLEFHLKGLPPTALGTVTVGCGTVINDCVARMKAVNKMVKDITPAAIHYASQAANVKAPPLPKINAISKAVEDHRNIVGKNITENLIAANNKLTSTLSAFTQQAKVEGWLASGMWFWHIADIQQALAERVDNKAYYTQFENNVLKGVVNSNINGLVRGAGLYAYDGQQLLDQTKGDVHDNSGVMEELTHLVNKYIGANLLSGFLNGLNSNNPLVTLQSWGNDVMDAASGVMGGYLALRYGEQVVGAIPFVGDILKALSGSKAVAALGAIVWFVSFSLLGVGAAYAIFLPSVPFVLVTYAFIGFAIVAIEAVVAGSIWAAAHAMPEGEGWAGTHGRQGYMMFLTVLLRPSLVIIGFFIAFNLYTAVMWFVGQSFGVFIESLEANYLIGFFSIIFIMILSLGVIGGSTLMIYRLMTHLAEKVLSWIGQLGQSLNETNTAERTRGSAAAGAAVVGGRLNKGNEQIQDAVKGAGQRQGGGGEDDDPPSEYRTEAPGGDSGRGPNSPIGGGSPVGPTGGGQGMSGGDAARTAGAVGAGAMTGGAGSAAVAGGSAGGGIGPNTSGQEFGATGQGMSDPQGGPWGNGGSQDDETEDPAARAAREAHLNEVGQQMEGGLYGQD